jgi:hypothetical protein
MPKKGQAMPKVDEFAFVLLAGIVLMLILTIIWSTPTESVPAVNPTSVSLSIQKGASSTFKLNISGTVLTNVTLAASGTIKDWVTFDKNNFNVGGYTIVTVTVKVPKTVVEGTKTGQITVSSSGGSKSVSVSIEVTKASTELSTKPIVLGDFSVSYSAGSDVLDSEKNVELTRGVFSGNEIDLFGQVSESKLETVTGGHVKLKVEETNSAGNLIVLFNNEEVFNSKANAGEIDIEIDASKIKATNTVAISAGSPGWMFWTTTTYDISSAEFLVDYEGIYSKKMTFSLDQKQIDNFNHFQLNYRVTDYSAPLPEMLINVNGQLVYWKRPPLTFFNDTFEKDVLGNKLVLNEGDNTISFSFEENAFYDVSNAVLTVYYLG